MTANFSPASGSLAPGDSVKVSVTIFTGGPQNSCWQSFSATLIFAGTYNTLKVPWSCTSPTYTSQPSNLDNTSGCQNTASNTWLCPVKIVQQGVGSLNFSTEQQHSSGGAYATFHPCCGSTDSPGQAVSVIVTIQVTSCPASEDLIFLTYQSVDIHWSCRTGQTSIFPPTPPQKTLMLQVESWRKEQRVPIPISSAFRAF